MFYICALFFLISLHYSSHLLFHLHCSFLQLSPQVSNAFTHNTKHEVHYVLHIISQCTQTPFFTMNIVQLSIKHESNLYSYSLHYINFEFQLQYLNMLFKIRSLNGT
jgi:hypothetical protein